MKGKEILFNFWKEYKEETDSDKRDILIEKYSELIDKKPKVGFLRQWINEDVKNKDHRLITNEDIEKFLEI